MTNPHRGEVELRAGDTIYTLRLTINAMVALEDHFGKGIAEVAALLSGEETFSLKTWRTVMAAMLQNKHPGTGEDLAGEIMSEAGMQEAMNAMGQAMSLAFPKAPKGAAGNPTEAGQPGRTGSASSPDTPQPGSTPAASGS